MNKKIGIIGFGNMGSAISGRIKKQYPVLVFDQDKDKTKRAVGVEAADNIAGLVTQTDAVILAVKPQDFDSLLKEIGDLAEDKLFISIAAGVTTGYIEKVLINARVIRVMPNMPAQIGEGITALSKGGHAKDEDLGLAEELFGFVGKTLVVEEGMMNAVTAVSGSGPAYVCYFLEAEGLSAEAVPSEKRNEFFVEFIKAAQGIGFSTKQAMLLVEETYKGTIRFLQGKRAVPSELRQQVASKGGTTEAALKILTDGGSLTEAVKAALGRAEELSRG